MSGGKPTRERAAISYAEYSDDEFDSPQKAKNKKRLIESDDEKETGKERALQQQGILKFAKRSGPEDTTFVSENSSRHRIFDKEDDIIDSSSADERGTSNRLRRAAATKPVIYAEPAVSEEEEEEEEVDLGETSEDEDESDSEAEEDVGTARPKQRVSTQSETHTSKTHDVSVARARRSRRNAAGSKRKNYNEDALHRQYYKSSDEDEDDSDTVCDKTRSAHHQNRGAAARHAILDSHSDEGSEDEDDMFNSDAENQEPQSRQKGCRAIAATRKGGRRQKIIIDVSSGSEDMPSDDDEISDKEENQEQASFTDLEGSDDGAGGGGVGLLHREENVTIATSVERILAVRLSSATGVETPEDQMYVKIKNKSYRCATWVTRRDLYDAGRQNLVRNFDKKRRSGELDPYGDCVDGVHPDWLTIDRVLAHKDSSIRGRLFLVKWRGLGYAESTWEPDTVLADAEADKYAVQRYFKFAQGAAAHGHHDGEDAKEEPAIEITAVPSFCNGRTLRPYQLESLQWMVKHWHSNTNCILGDEMGLGKTAQAISVLAFQRQFGGVNGPFLVVAPLTTLGHWQREIETWTDMNCIVYAGSQADRDVIKRFDLWVPGSRGRRLKPHIVLSSYETILRDQTLFQSIEWESVVVDEAHRMKTVGSSTRTAIADIPMNWLLLLTGTPVQNNMRELFGLLNLLDPESYPSEASFAQRFGDDRGGGVCTTPAQVKLLQEALRPVLLRRMKEDVETLPEKEECIIWVQLAVEQRAYYKAIFEGQIGTLMAGASAKNMPNMRNLAMELRKVCCHPFLCDGLEADIAARRAANGLHSRDDVSALAESSGKMVLLHKLLPKLRSEGHKVLIFSQFKMMLDVLEDYVKLSGHPFERIDGSTSGRDRQAAIDRFSNPDSDSFIFLLSTRAGGQGITLTAADTCIIYDSDWNPQNDLQAMARCHRIGQDKDVTIYRLVSRDTYEEHVFQISSKKYGLDEAILGGIGGPGGGLNACGGGDPEADGKKIAALLKHGAHCITSMDAANQETEAFASEDIDEILKGRTEKRQIGGRAGNTFSVATFDVGSPMVAGGGGGTAEAALAAEAAAGGGGGVSDKEFWAALLPEAAQKHEEERAAAAMPVFLPPRQKKKVDYSEGIRKRRGQRAPSDDTKGSDSDFNPGSDSDSGHIKPAAVVPKAAPAPHRWSGATINNFLDRILRVGFARHMQAAAELKLLDKRPSQEVAEVAVALERLLDRADVLKPPKPERVPILAHERVRQLNLIVTGKHHPNYPNSNFTEMKAQDIEEANCTAMALAAARVEKLKMDAAFYEERVKTAGAQLVPATMALPSSAERAIRDGKFGERLVRNVDRYKEHLAELNALHEFIVKGTERGDDAGGGGVAAAPFVGHPKGLPYWWTRDDDVALLKGAHALGWDVARNVSKLRGKECDVEAILSDARFGFCSKLAPAPLEEVRHHQGQAEEEEKETNAEPEHQMQSEGIVTGGDTKGDTHADNNVVAGKESPPGSIAGDSFVVKQDSEESVSVAGHAAVPIPAAAAAGGGGGRGGVPAPLGRPQFLDLEKWNKLKETVAKHTRNLLKALVSKRATRHSVIITSSQERKKGSLQSCEDSGHAVAIAPGGSGPKTLLKQALHTSFSKQLAMATKEMKDVEPRTLPTLDTSGAVPAPFVEDNCNAVPFPIPNCEDPIESVTSEDDMSVDKVHQLEEEEEGMHGIRGSNALPPPGLVAENTTPGDRVPALNVFGETRGSFTDPQALTDMPGGSGPTVRNSKKESVDTSGPALSDDGSAATAAVAGKKQGQQAMRQCSLFEMHRLKRMKRTCDGLEDVEVEERAERSAAEQEQEKIEVID